uniref:Protein tilB homolog isoform X3 n=1 Tax=Phascolarctos cinereus TaxID=38626 RepID=A0A6P5JW00_PHACI|nr:protein tilB homolog isoform X3 [Phascolarctos cinereus]
MRQQDMSESSSGLNRSSRDICESNSSHYSELSETNTWTTLCRNRGTLHSYSDSGISSPLPSDSFKYLTWNNLDQHDVQGNQLRCPRVRKGPSEEDLLFRREEYNFPPKKKALGDPYQADNLNRILRRLIRVRTLWLVDNSLTDLSAIRLPRCKELNVSKNCFTSFKQLPKIPETRHLSLAENQIATLSGLSSLQSTPLESLMLKRNPCEFHQNYRKQVFSSLPNLKVLDGVPKLPEDHSLPEMSLFSKMCTIF